MAAGTHGYGFSDNFTGDVHGELLSHQKTGGFGAAWLAPVLGILSGSVAGSSSERGRGGLVQVGYERQARRIGFGASAQAASERFTQLGLQPDELAPRQQSQLFASLSTPGFGSLGLGYTHRGYRDRPDVELISTSYSLGLSRYAFFNVAVIRSLGPEARSSATLTIVIPLGVRSTATAMALSQKDRHQVLGQVQQSLPAGEGWGYRLLGAVFPKRRVAAFRRPAGARRAAHRAAGKRRAPPLGGNGARRQRRRRVPGRLARRGVCQRPRRHQPPARELARAELRVRPRVCPGQRSAAASRRLHLPV